MIPQTTELSQIQAAFIDKDNRIEELMRQINSAQSLLNSPKETTNSLVGDGKITIKTYAGSNVGDFTVNQKEDKTITLPQQATVNNGKLTITRNGTSVGTFTANQSGNTTANITVPTKTSEITNDSGFVTSNDVLLKANNLSDLQSTDAAISNLIDNAQISGVYTNNAKFLIKNTGVLQNNPTGAATVGDLIAHTKNQLYTDYSGTKTITKTFVTLFTHPTSLLNKRIEISINGGFDNETFLGSTILINYISSYTWTFALTRTDTTQHYLQAAARNDGKLNLCLSSNDTWTSVSMRYNIRVWN